MSRAAREPQESGMDTSTEQVRVNWREAGDGAPAVLLHGFPFNSAMWEPQLTSVPAGWRFIAPDLRGFGGSSAAPGDGAYTMPAFAHDVALLLDHLEAQRVVLCGLSMGGYIALEFWRLFPERVMGLVLSDTRATPDDDGARANRYALAEKVGSHGAAAVLEAMLPKLFSPATVKERPDVVERVRSMMEVAPVDTLRRSLLGMAERSDTESLLRMIQVPTLVLVGADDAITPPGDAQLIARGIRGSRIETIADAGHLPNLEQPQAFNHALHGFLRSSINPDALSFTI
jgi:pimeloyl-ACP methyl ester carboxylesterase